MSHLDQPMLEAAGATATLPNNAQLRMGTCWDPMGIQTFDLDAACSVFDACGLMLDCCFFNNTHALGGGIVHSGDSTDGKAPGEDEFITINLAMVPPHAAALMLTVHCYEKGDFRKCESAQAHLSMNGQVCVTYSMGSLGSATSAVFMIIQRNADGASWSATPARNTMNAPIRTPTDALPTMLSLLKIDPTLQRELASRQPVLSVKKGQSLTIPFNMGSVGVGLGWNSRVDVDASAICLNIRGVMVDKISYQKLTGLNGNVKHSGDNRTGEGSGDDETIKVELAKIPVDVTHIFFVINVFSGGSFSDVQGEYARLVDFTQGQAGKEFCRVGEMDSGSMNGLVFAVLYRGVAPNNQWWHYAAIGTHAMGKVAQELVDECQAWQQGQVSGKIKPQEVDPRQTLVLGPKGGGGICPCTVL